MNITEVRVFDAVVRPPYKYRFDAGARNIVWDFYASNFDEWASGDDPIAKAQFEIEGVRTIESEVGIIPAGTRPAHWRTGVNVSPYSETGVLQLKSLCTASGKLRWMNPDL